VQVARDILIGGRLSFDNNAAALAAVLPSEPNDADYATAPRLTSRHDTRGLNHNSDSTIFYYLNRAQCTMTVRSTSYTAAPVRIGLLGIHGRRFYQQPHRMTR